MKRLNLLLLLAILALAACSGSGEEGDSSVVCPVDTMPTVSVRLVIQQPKTTRIDPPTDPGDSVSETADWDAIYIIWAYVYDKYGNESNSVDYLKLTKTDFESLPAYDDAGLYRSISIPMTEGKLYLYGVTCTDELLPTLGKQIDACKSYLDVEALTISNDYASTVTDGTRWDKFCSVATGYCVASSEVDTDLTPEGDRLITIEDTPASGVDERIYFYMPVRRLASKIDIQWDAQEAYTDAKYEDVRVTDFTFCGNAGYSSNTGYGRLFPALYAQDVASKSAISGNSTFINTTVVSQRNGRQYHYVFPDGVSQPSFTFSVTANKVDGSTNTFVSTAGTLNLGAALQQAAWYKVNLTVKGVTSSGTWTHTLMQ